MTDTIQKPRQKTHTPPAKQWRNWWEKARSSVTRDRGSNSLTYREAGEVFCGETAWPSKEIAEQKALDVIASDTSRGRVPNKYLGAEPVE